MPKKTEYNLKFGFLIEKLFSMKNFKIENPKGKEFKRSYYKISTQNKNIVNIGFSEYQKLLQTNEQTYKGFVFCNGAELIITNEFFPNNAANSNKQFTVKLLAYRGDKQVLIPVAIAIPESKFKNLLSNLTIKRCDQKTMIEGMIFQSAIEFAPNIFPTFPIFSQATIDTKNELAKSYLFAAESLHNSRQEKEQNKNDELSADEFVKHFTAIIVAETNDMNIAKQFAETYRETRKRNETAIETYAEIFVSARIYSDHLKSMPFVNDPSIMARRHAIITVQDKIADEAKTKLF